MPSKQKAKAEEEFSDESYDVEDDGSENMDQSDTDLREVNQANLLNYQSDDSDEDMEGEDSDAFDTQIKQQKQQLLTNDAWGSKKKNFYGRDKKRDDVSSSEDDQDEYQEALRLQKVRAKKLQQQVSDEEDQPQPEQSDEDIEESEDDDEELLLQDKNKKKLGDRLFDDHEQQSLGALNEVSKQLNPKVLKAMIDKESPELQGLLEEFQEALDTLNTKLRPVLDKAQKSQIETKHGMTYLEMKYNLLLSYCTFLSFYLLMKVEGKSVKDHPVIFKLAHIKTLIEKLKPLDQRLQYQIDKMLRTAAVAKDGDTGVVQDNMKYKPNVKNLKMSDNEEDEDYGDEEQVDESDVQDDLDENESEQDDVSEQDQPKSVFKAAKLNPVHYEDSQTKKQRREELQQKKKMSKSQYIDELRKEMYDEPEEVHMGAIHKKTKINKEQDMIEQMEQEHFKRMQFSKKEMKKMKQRQQDELQERLDQLDDLKDIENIVSSKHNKDRQQMHMDAELDNSKFQKSLSNYIKNASKSKSKSNNQDLLENTRFKKTKPTHAQEPASKKRKLNFNDFDAKHDIQGDDLYQGQKEKLRDKKAKKKAQGKESKEQRLQEVAEMDQSIQRNVGYDIIKNKGLTRKRKKIDRNPRVKLREKYRKAMIKHGSKVQQFKEGPQKKYGGEATGLRSNLIKSTKLT